MTRDDLIILAREAGLDFSDPRVKQIVRSSFSLGAAKEREACAKLIEDYKYWLGKTGKEDIAKAIRARGEA